MEIAIQLGMSGTEIRKIYAGFKLRKTCIEQCEREIFLSGGKFVFWSEQRLWNI
jgi:hypothetical protein